MDRWTGRQTDTHTQLDRLADGQWMDRCVERQTIQVVERQTDWQMDKGENSWSDCCTYVWSCRLTDRQMLRLTARLKDGAGRTTNRQMNRTVKKVDRLVN
jgi:hypothetical protein